MSYHRKTVTAMKTAHSFSWSWYAMPALITAVVLSTLFTAGGSQAGEDATAASLDAGAPHHAMLLPASPEPGEGEPALVASAIAQSY